MLATGGCGVYTIGTEDFFFTGLFYSAQFLECGFTKTVDGLKKTWSKEMLREEIERVRAGHPRVEFEASVEERYYSERR